MVAVSVGIRRLGEVVGGFRLELVGNGGVERRVGPGGEGQQVDGVLRRF